VTSALLTRISADGPGVSPQDLARLDLPVLVIGHGRDAVHPLALAQGLAGMIPGARLVEITAKADDPARYRHDFRAALAAYLNRLSETEYPDASRS
jgi:pimeloyl-ACP methyl ester carboxylesterase